MSWLSALWLLIRAAVRGRRDLALENLALRQQLLVLNRKFRRHVQNMGIIDMPITPGHWPQNAYCERVNGTLRRECTDHVIALNERHLLGIVREYVEQYYNVVRPHLRLDRNAPIPRQRETEPAAQVTATPVLGGLHHRYERAA